MIELLRNIDANASLGFDRLLSYFYSRALWKASAFPFIYLQSNMLLTSLFPMRTISIFLGFLVMTSLFSCDEPDDNFPPPVVVEIAPIVVTDLILGVTVADCFPTVDCARLYHIKGGQAFKDLNVERFSRHDTTTDLSYIEFSNVPLQQVDTSTIDSLVVLLPSMLMTYKEIGFDCSGCGGGDESVIQIVINRGESTQERFALDSYTDRMVPELRTYAELIQRANDVWRRE